MSDVLLQMSADELDESVAQVIALCDGDHLAALKTLLVANTLLEAEVERLSAALSHGFVRGRMFSSDVMERLWRGC